MIKVTASGNIGKDAELKEFGENNVINFSIASNKKIKGEDVTIWLDCQIWNKSKLEPYLLKGTKVIVHGDLEIKKHEDKYYTRLKVWELEFTSKPEQKSEQQESKLPPSEEPDLDLPF